MKRQVYLVPRNRFVKPTGTDVRMFDLRTRELIMVGSRDRADDMIRKEDYKLVDCPKGA